MPATKHIAYLNDNQQHLPRVQPIDQAQARPQVCEASPVMLACCIPVMSRHTRTEEERQVQEQDLGQKEHTQPGCVCALVALAHTVADGWAVVIKPVNASAQHQPQKCVLQAELAEAKCYSS